MQVAYEFFVVQEHQLLNIGDPADCLVAATFPDGVLEQGFEVLGLAPSQQQRRVLGAVVAPPQVIVAGQDSTVVLELDEVERVARQHQQVDLMPAAPVVAELEVGPGAEWLGVGQLLLDCLSFIPLLPLSFRGVLSSVGRCRSAL
jgi:hypothetical protein